MMALSMKTVLVMWRLMGSTASSRNFMKQQRAWIVTEASLVVVMVMTEIWRKGAGWRGST